MKTHSGHAVATRGGGSASGEPWLNRSEVSESKGCVGVGIQVIQAERMVAVRNWRIEIFISDGWWTRSEQFRSTSEVSTGELSE